MLEDYEPLSLIGKGNFGSITKIRRKSDDKILVWKELYYGMMNEKNRSRLVSEVSILRELHHPNIVKYYDRIIDKKNSKLYIIMEYCNGGDIRHLIKHYKSSNKLIPESLIWKIFSQVVCALYACHFHKTGKILHRDIKPSNIFIDSENNNIKLGDFGLSRILNEEKLACSKVGTPFYMSPEQIKGILYDEKSDIWSLGCLLYELATLHPPFWGKNRVELAGNIKNGKFEKISDIYSDNLWKVIKWLINVDQNQRPNIKEIMEFPDIKIRIKEKNVEEKMKIIKEKENVIIDKEKKLLIKEKYLIEKEKSLKKFEEFLKIKNKEYENNKKNNKLDVKFNNKKLVIIKENNFFIENNNENNSKKYSNNKKKNYNTINSIKYNTDSMFRSNKDSSNEYNNIYHSSKDIIENGKVYNFNEKIKRHKISYNQIEKVLNLKTNNKDINQKIVKRTYDDNDFEDIEFNDVENNFNNIKNNNKKNMRISTDYKYSCEEDINNLINNHGKNKDFEKNFNTPYFTNYKTNYNKITNSFREDKNNFNTYHQKEENKINTNKTIEFSRNLKKKKNKTPFKNLIINLNDNNIIDNNYDVINKIRVNKGQSRNKSEVDLDKHRNSFNNQFYHNTFSINQHNLQKNKSFNLTNQSKINDNKTSYHIKRKDYNELNHYIGKSYNLNTINI